MTTALLSLLFFCFSLFLSSRSFFSFLSRKKIMYFPSCIKKSSTRWCFEENFFVFFCTHKRSTKGAQKEHKRKRTNTRSRSHHHQSSSFINRHITFFHLFSSSHQHQQQKHTTRPLLLRDFFCDYAHAERERACVRLREREKERGEV